MSSPELAELLAQQDEVNCTLFSRGQLTVPVRFVPPMGSETAAVLATLRARLRSPPLDASMEDGPDPLFSTWKSSGAGELLQVRAKVFGAVHQAGWRLTPRFAVALDNKSVSIGGKSLPLERVGFFEITRVLAPDGTIDLARPLVLVHPPSTWPQSILAGHGLPDIVLETNAPARLVGRLNRALQELRPPATPYRG